MVTLERFNQFLELCVEVNKDVVTGDLCDTVGCENCPLDHISEEPEECMEALRTLLNRIKEVKNGSY